MKKKHDRARSTAPVFSVQQSIRDWELCKTPAAACSIQIFFPVISYSCAIQVESENVRKFRKEFCRFHWFEMSWVVLMFYECWIWKYFCFAINSKYIQHTYRINCECVLFCRDKLVSHENLRNTDTESACVSI